MIEPRMPHSLGKIFKIIYPWIIKLSGWNPLAELSLQFALLTNMQSIEFNHEYSIRRTEDSTVMFEHQKTNYWTSIGYNVIELCAYVKYAYVISIQGASEDWSELELSRIFGKSSERLTTIYPYILHDRFYSAKEETKAKLVRASVSRRENALAHTILSHPHLTECCVVGESSFWCLKRSFKKW